MFVPWAAKRLAERTAMVTFIFEGEMSRGNGLYKWMSGRGQKKDQREGEDALMKATNDVTEALQRTIGLMQGELERSVLSTQLLGTHIVNESVLSLILGC